MVKSLFKKLGLALLVITMVQAIAYAQEGSTQETEPNSPQSASFKSRCENVPDGWPPCANSPADCASTSDTVGEGESAINVNRTPFNCIFLEEPIGGQTGFDLYKVTPVADSDDPTTTLWYGEAIVGNVRGPIQAILAYEPGNETQGPFGLLYSYLGLVYNFLSGIIIGFVVLVVIVGGIRITTAAGNQQGYESGRDMIIKALIGMALWFTASVILYTINPTFFAF